MANSYPVSNERMVIRSGNLDEVKKLAWNSCVINKPDERGWTLLHEAAVNDRYVDIAQFLISAGALVNFKTSKGVTPLYIACKNGCEMITRLLIEAGCNINTVVTIDYVSGQIFLKLTPLHIACKHGSFAIVKLLLENNANVNAIEGKGCTPVHFAIGYSDVAIIRILIESGANLKMKDFQGYTPLHHACMLGNFEMFNILLEHLGCDKPIIDEQTPDGLTLLMLACNFQHYNIAEKLIECGADTTVVNSVELLALHMAANGGLDLFKLLLQHTPNEVIEKCASFRSGFNGYRSLPCIIIDSKAFESLELLYQSGVSEEVLKCPNQIRGHLLSPIGHLLMFTNSWSDNETRLKFLEFLLSHDFLINPIYGGEENPQITISLFEAVVQMHAPCHEDCYCERFLSLILLKIPSPHKGLPCILSREVSMFSLAARDGFIAALGLLKYTECIEPDDMMKTFLSDISEPQYRWNGRETVVIKYLLEKCSTNVMSEVWAMKNSKTGLNPVDWRKHMIYHYIYEEVKSCIRVVPLKKMCRFILRKHVREQAKASSQSFRSHLQNILLPPFLSRYILYEMDF
ncbi:ankyrin repeat and SOCS box protein 3 [Halyomorpha halys]|uniref:ankyrin repeat and SOCS box protein 3 n=1 Tax=Halyomorpha halys TaxID=286706 RepID=UPI0006D51161|nr:ankyrin-1-like [Halyomorpha halys]